MGITNMLAPAMVDSLVSCAVSFLAGLWAAKLIGLGAGQDPAEHAPPIFAPTLRNDFGVADGPGKMILVVNAELKMGKICVNCPTGAEMDETLFQGLTSHLKLL